MGYCVKGLPQRLEGLPNLEQVWHEVGKILGVSTLLEHEWVVRQPAVLGASIMLVVLMSFAGIQLEDLGYLLKIIHILGVPMAFYLVGGK